MDRHFKNRRSLVVLLLSLVVGWSLSYLAIDDFSMLSPQEVEIQPGTALEQLEGLAVKGRAPKTDYRRSQFGSGWATRKGCTVRNQILNRDLSNVKMDDDCQVKSGKLNDPYTGNTIFFIRGPGTSNLVQIDHVVALSNAWQTGAQGLSYQSRVDFANDPLNLLAVDGAANQQKGDADAATWLPSNKAFRCQYVARQIAVKARYKLYVVPAEKDAMHRVLGRCPATQALGG